MLFGHQYFIGWGFAASILAQIHGEIIIVRIERLKLLVAHVEVQQIARSKRERIVPQITIARVDDRPDTMKDANRRVVDDSKAIALVEAERGVEGEEEVVVERNALGFDRLHRSEERRVGKECRSRWSP